ncbi:MAG: DUF4175 domain-containing protein, partial [Planctomycetes bacterium]|nr:DUF4175 domain-containing protein [Planctomycetota bacterium]
EARQARRSLSDSNAAASLSEQLTGQKNRARELIDDMKELTDASEASEPLLSRKLYETLRQTGTDNLDQALEVTEELVRRNFLTEAERLEQRAAEGIRTLRQGVEDAAQSVLGDPTDALRQARAQLDTLLDQVEQEMSQAQSEQPQPGQEGQPGQQSAPGQAGQEGQAPVNPPGQDGNRGGRTGPFTGQDYAAWSDRLRDVEEILNDQAWRDDAARVRDRARSMRADFVRHGVEPQWDLVRQSVMQPLTDLRKQVKDELARLEKDQMRVPIDRDPVPGLYEDRVKRYFETLGEDQ